MHLPSEGGDEVEMLEGGKATRCMCASIQERKARDEKTYEFEDLCKTVQASLHGQNGYMMATSTNLKAWCCRGCFTMIC